MKKALTLIYVLTTLSYSVIAVMFEWQPALFWINLFAQNIGDTYPMGSFLNNLNKMNRGIK